MPVKSIKYVKLKYKYKILENNFFVPATKFLSYRVNNNNNVT